MPTDGSGRSLAGPLAGTILFVLVVPGTVIGLVPWWITGWELAPPFLGLAITRGLGALLLLAGLPVFADFLWRFVAARGTPAPVAETETLVTTGTFRWVRNPGYVAVLALLLGQSLLFASLPLLLYTAAVATTFHLFVVYYEEPRLRERFGAEYDA